MNSVELALGATAALPLPLALPTTHSSSQPHRPAQSKKQRQWVSLHESTHSQGTAGRPTGSDTDASYVSCWHCCRSCWRSWGTAVHAHEPHGELPGEVEVASGPVCECDALAKAAGHIAIAINAAREAAIPDSLKAKTIERHKLVKAS
eukprot:1762548-Prymnesium_polylepis.1